MYYYGTPGFNFKRDSEGKLVHVPSQGGIHLGKDVEIFSGTNICLGTEPGSMTYIGDGAKIDVLCHIAHDVKIGKHVGIAAGCILGGRSEIGDYSFLGVNVSVKPRVKIGRNCYIGAHSLVTKDVPDGEVWMGVPARFHKKNELRWG